METRETKTKREFASERPNRTSAQNAAKQLKRNAREIDRDRHFVVKLDSNLPFSNIEILCRDTAPMNIYRLSFSSYKKDETNIAVWVMSTCVPL